MPGYCAGMKRFLALMLVVAAPAPAAFAQPQTESRLAGGPERICTEDEIRQAMDGSYAGPPCRFTEIPAGMTAPRSDVARPAVEAAAEAQPVSPPILRARPQAAQPELARPVSHGGRAISPRPAHRPVVMVSGSSGSSHVSSQQGTSWQAETSVRQWPPAPSGPVASAPPRPIAPASNETVRLSDDFFRGGLVGGVERPFTPVYSYRGLILIAADGQVRTGHAGLEHRVLQTRALDQRAAPRPQAGPRRAWPYPSD